MRFYKTSLVNKISRRVEEIKKENNIRRSIDVILEGVTHINKMLEEARYFYIDLIKEGILLFDTKRLNFKQVKNLTPEERLKKQKEDFKIWFPS
ncbi:MAG: hypothetical protein D3903_00870 [Candidatus Electrothrix sp. GM3_4]|nr:hypothetical protein [Candidatus Electrothrix sp. GM3_4]